MALNNAAAAFIGASVTLVLVIIFMILMVILVRQCLAFLAKRNTMQGQVEAQHQARTAFEAQRRISVTEPVPATFDWHHSIRVAGTPPPTYKEARHLPSFEDAIVAHKRERGTEGEDAGESSDSESSSRSDNGVGEESDNRGLVDHSVSRVSRVSQRRHVVTSIVIENERNSQMLNSESLVPNGTQAHDTREQSPDPSTAVHAADDVQIELDADSTSV